MVVIIPLSLHSSNNFTELRYALRGIELYISKPEIILIGAKPSWIKNVEVVPKVDRTETIWKERNIYDKLMLGAELAGEDFLYANDDHFLMEPWQEQYFYSGTLEEKLYACPRGSIYRNTVVNTMRLCSKGLNFDCHCPIIMSPEMLEPLKKVKWDLHYGYCVKTLYCHLNNIKGTNYPDLKFKFEVDYANQVKGRKYFSTDDRIIDENMIKLLNKLYPKPSKFENDIKK